MECPFNEQPLIICGEGQSVRKEKQMKLEVGKQYDTAHGKATYQGFDTVMGHTFDGERCTFGAKDIEALLIKEIKEPETKTVYVHWWDNGDVTLCGNLVRFFKNGEFPNKKATAKITLIEGQFDE